MNPEINFTSVPDAYAARVAVVAAIAALLALSTFFRFGAYSGLSGGRAAMGLVGSWVAAVAVVMWRLGDVRLMGTGPRSDDLRLPVMITLMSSAILVLFAIPFALRLHGKWLGGRMTEEERTPGGAGFRAWLSPMNLFLAVVISLSCAMAFQVPLLLPLFVTLGLLVITPLLSGMPPAAHEPPVIKADPSPGEREKVLALLEAGKITAEESAELLNALGASAGTQQPVTVPISAPRRLAMIGAAIVLVGFFLPWFVVSPSAELSRMMGQMQNGMRSFSQSFTLPGSVGAGQMPLESMPNVHGHVPAPFAAPNLHMPDMGKISISGGDIGKGLGWLVLALAAVGAFLPHMMSTLDRATMRRLRLVALAIGSVVLVWLASSSLRAISIGFLVVLAGYVVEWIGVWREERPVASESFAGAQTV